MKTPKLTSQEVAALLLVREETIAGYTAPNERFDSFLLGWSEEEKAKVYRAVQRYQERLQRVLLNGLVNAEGKGYPDRDCLEKMLSPPKAALVIQCSSRSSAMADTLLLQKDGTWDDNLDSAVILLDVAEARKLIDGLGTFDVENGCVFPVKLIANFGMGAAEVVLYTRKEE